MSNATTQAGDPDQHEIMFCTRCGTPYQFVRRRGRLMIPKRLRCRGCRTYVETCNWRALSPKIAPQGPPAEPEVGTDEIQQFELFAEPNR